MAEQSLKEKTAKGLFWGGLSNGVNQLLTTIFGIFLARILNAEDYGMIGMLSIFSLMASTIQDSGFRTALINKKTIYHKDYNAVFWFSILTGLALYILLYLCSPLIARFYNTPELTPVARYSFLGFLIASTGIVPNAYMYRNLMVRERAIAGIVSLTISGVAGIILAFLGMSYWGIATQNILYVLSISICYWYFSKWKPSIKINFQPLKGMLSFSTKILFTSLFDNINSNLFQIFLGKYYSKDEVGYYSRANQWNFTGHSFISSMVNNVAQPVLNTVSDDIERQQRVFRKMLRFTAFVSFPVMFGIALIAREFIIITVTEKWLPTVEILQLLCIGGAFVPITFLFSNLIITKGKSNIYMWNTMALGLLQMITMIFTSSYGIRTMIIVYVCISISWVFVWYYFVWKEINISLWNVAKDILPYAFIALAVMTVTFYITRPITNIYLVFVAKIIIAATLYTLCMWLSNSVTFKESLQFIKNRRR